MRHLAWNDDFLIYKRRVRRKQRRDVLEMLSINKDAHCCIVDLLLAFHLLRESLIPEEVSICWFVTALCERIFFILAQVRAVFISKADTISHDVVVVAFFLPVLDDFDFLVFKVSQCVKADQLFGIGSPLIGLAWLDIS